MTTYSDVFGGANIYPTEISFSALTLSTSVTLDWPTEISTSQTPVTRIMDLVATVPGLTVTMPPANATGVGQTVLFTNRGANAIEVLNAASAQIVNLAPGLSWQIYVADNSTSAGVWRSLQYGASVSTASAAALAGTGLVAVGSLLSQSIPVVTFNTNFTTTTADRAKMYNWTGASGTFTLPDPTSVGNNWFACVRNSGTGALSVDAPGTSLIDGGSALSFQPGESAIVASDGSNYFTIGFGQSATFAFDYTVINVAGTGDYTLTGTELNRIAYRFSGALTGNRNIIVPATIQQYWVDNQTTGAYTLTIKTPAGSGVSVSTGQRAILYCDGTNVLDADTAGISIPLDVTQGGTGAITPSAARINLGASSVGNALFTAADQAAAWAALGPAPAGLVDGGTF